MRLIIASRKSDLARIQALSVGAAIKKANPDFEIRFNFRESLGDKNLSDPLWKMPEKGVFTEDFYQDLVEGRCDMVVHSWKDLPTEPRPDTEIFATLERADLRDMLLMKKSAWSRVQKRGEASIYSSSPRRAYNLGPFLIQALPAKIERVKFESVRGNVPTRVTKLLNDDAIDGLIVAKAALDRLLSAGGEEFKSTQSKLREQLARCLLMILPLRQNPTAAAQGALAIEVAKHRPDVKKVLEKIQVQETFRAVEVERELLAGYGGGCHQKIGVSHVIRPFGEITFIRALTDAGQAIDEIRFAPKAKPGERVSDARIFPLAMKDAAFFDRVPLQVNLPEGPLWIAKADALPEGARVETDRLVWVSGWETWKKLARRGVWVTGSAESLGESEDPRLDILLNGGVSWTKLSHDRTSGYGTYSLIPKNVLPDLSGKTHFWWVSGSSFQLALEKFPAIRDGVHSCGPGNTFDIISRLLGREPFVFLSYEDWLRQVRK